MTELDFYKWVNKWQPEWQWDINDGYQDVLMWISIYSIESFYDLLPYSSFCEGGISARLVDKTIAIWAREILHPFNISLEKVFTKENTD
jgi:hypothetical protein